MSEASSPENIIQKPESPLKRVARGIKNLIKPDAIAD